MAKLQQCSNVPTEQTEKSSPGNSSTELPTQTPKIPTSDIATGRRNGSDTFNITETIRKCAIDTNLDLMEPPILLKIDQSPIATLGNFSLLIGKAKAGKTFLVTALTTATLVQKCSIENITGIKRDTNKILYFDTEQGPYHAQRMVKRICKQIGDDNLKNFTSFALRPINPSLKWKVVKYCIENTPDIALVVIDGIADLLSSGINDESEAIQLTSEILRWSQDYNVHIILVLHQNKNDFNARGHIGSYLVNKAETVLSVSKDAKDRKISIVKAEYCRDIDFESFAFIINENGLPVVCSTMEGSQSRKVETMTEKMKGCFVNEKKIGYNELFKLYTHNASISTPTAKRHIKECLGLNIIKKDSAKNYYLPQDYTESELPF